MNSEILVEIWRLEAYLKLNPTKAASAAIRYKTEYLRLKNKYKLLTAEIDQLIREIIYSPKDSPSTEYVNLEPTKCSFSIEQKFELESLKRTLKLNDSDYSKSRVIAVDCFKRYLILDFKYQNLKNRFDEVRENFKKKEIQND